MSSRELFDLAFRHHQQGDLARAELLYRQLLQAEPAHADALRLLGTLYHQAGNPRAALTFLDQALALCPNNASTHYHLGLVHQGQGQLAPASACYKQALQIDPNHADARNNLGVALKNQGHVVEAIACYRQALTSEPRHASAFNNLGTALYFHEARLDEARHAFEEAIHLKPDFAEAHSNLGNVLKDQGRIEEALACYRRALEGRPDYLGAYSNLLYALYYSPAADARSIREEHERWSRKFARPLAKFIKPHLKERAPQRRLRVGYLSADFRNHVAARHFWPLLRCHERRHFDITLYAQLTSPDAMSERLRNCADHWCPIAALSDQQVADKIRQDDIDILVDLSVHTAGNRLLIFAYKPAPLQVSFLGYPGNTGLETIDYRLTDPYFDPPGLGDLATFEKPYRLPHSLACYDLQGEEEQPVAPLPALARGFITFGCLNNFCKINERVLDLWARVLLAVEGSRLTLFAHEGCHRQRTLDYLAKHGIAAERVTFHSFKPRPGYLSLYAAIDIGLDTFPYNGHTTSLDSLWMGVPVVSLIGEMPVGRGGLSQLTNLGLPELAAKTPEDFIQIAVNLAGNLSRLQNLRGSLRTRMKQSPLMDAAGFARAIEEAYRNMWQEWCLK